MLKVIFQNHPCKNSGTAVFHYFCFSPTPTPMIEQKTLIVSIDLGTSATTASHITVNDSFKPEGKLRRERGRVNITNIRGWPGGNNGDAVGNVCVPTDLIYARADDKLLLWAFRAQ